MKAFITAQLTDDAMDYIKKHADVKVGGWAYDGKILKPEELVEQAGNPDFMVICYEEITDYVLDNIPNLKFISCTRGGAENIDREVVNRHKNVFICNAPGRNANAVAEVTIGLMINISRHISLTYRYIMNRDWEKAKWFDSGSTNEKPFMGYEMEGKILGLVGFGEIGRRVAKIARDGFGMQIIFYDPYVKEAENAVGKSLEEVLSKSDFVSLHTFPTDETIGMINEKTLRLMKPSAYLINTARGKLIVESDLYVALKEHWIAGAALDTLYPEPIQPDNPLLDLDNILITPHIGGASIDILPQQTKIAMLDVRAFIETGRPIHVL